MTCESLNSLQSLLEVFNFDGLNVLWVT